MTMSKVHKNIPRGLHKKGSDNFNAIRSGYLDRKRKDLESFTRKHITKTIKEMRDEIHSIEVNDHSISLFDKNDELITKLK